MKDIIFIFFFFLGIIAIVSGIVLLVYYTDSYLTLKDVINRCNKDLGPGNWTFIETKDSYQCNKISSSMISNKWCFENGIEVPC